MQDLQRLLACESLTRSAASTIAQKTARSAGPKRARAGEVGAKRRVSLKESDDPHDASGSWGKLTRLLLDVQQALREVSVELELRLAVFDLPEAIPLLGRGVCV